MSIKISHKKGISEKNIRNLVLFCDDDFKINGISKLLIYKNLNQINKTINSERSKKKDIIIFNLNANQKIIAIKIKNNLKSTDNEKKRC